MIGWSVALAVLVLAVPAAQAKILTAASCSQSDVQAMVNQAVDGDTVVVPAGSCTWGNGAGSNIAPVSIGYDPATGNPSVAFPRKSITLIGAGIDQTIITDGQGKNNFPNVPQILWWDTNDNAPARLTGFTFRGGTIVDAFNKGIVFVRGVSHSFRMDHNKFLPTLTNAYTLDGFLWGVIDHNILVMSSDTETGGSYIHMGGWVGPNGAGSPPIYGDGSWNDADTFGTNKAMFVEDNTFTTTRSSQQYCNDGWKGSRVVYRHNTYTNCLWANHGTDSPGRWRSQRQYEVYNNTFTISNGLTWPSVIGSRGGTGVVYNNTVTTSGGSTVFSVHDLHSYRPENHSAAYAFSATPFNQCTSGTGTCESGTSTSPGAFASWASGCPNVNNSCLSVWDGNAPTGANTWPGYPALDQPGRGAGDLISGDTPLNQVTGTATWPHQALDPVYAWNNTINGSVVNIVVSDSDPAGVFVLGVDYFNIPKPGYTAYCYPHPLVSGASCGAMASPASPGNVQVH